MSKEFKVGDRVTAFGVEGQVERITCNDPRYPNLSLKVEVVFSDDNVDWFTLDGRLNTWHKFPSLFHAKPKKKLYLWACIDDYGMIMLCRNYFETEADCRIRNPGFNKVIRLDHTMIEVDCE